MPRGRKRAVVPVVDVVPLKAYLRIRPLTKTEIDRAKQFAESEVYSLKNGDTVTVNPPGTSAFHRSGIGNEVFQFTDIFGPDTDQAKVFNMALSDPIKIVLNQGFNLLMFAYGVTSSGKSYTMMGNRSHPGIIPRFVNAVFEKLSQIIPYIRIIALLINIGLLNLVFCFFVVKRIKSKDFSISGIIALSTKVQKYPEVEPVSSSAVKKLNLESAAKRRAILGVKTNDDLSIMQTPLTNTKTRIIETMNLESSLMNSVAPKTIDRCGADNKLGNDCKLPDFEVTLNSYTIWCSYCELYGNQLNDLLQPNGEKLIIREDHEGKPYIHGLTYIPCYNVGEVLECLAVGRRNLSIASTKLNERSSRSHSIFSFMIICDTNGGKQTNATTASDSGYFTRSAHFCDLAGSERAKKAQGNTERFKEMCAINSSLLNLQRCIDLLRGNNKNEIARPPYRSSKLTRLFQPFFEGSGVVRMMANVCFDPYLFDETINVLKFCAMAQTVVLKRRAPVAAQNFELATKSAKQALDAKYWVSDDDNKPYKISVNELIAKINDLRQQIVSLQTEKEDLLNEWTAGIQSLQTQHISEMHNIENVLIETYHDEMEQQMKIFRKRYQNRYGRYIRIASERLKILQEYGCEACKQRDEEVSLGFRGSMDCLEKLDEDEIENEGKKNEDNADMEIDEQI